MSDRTSPVSPCVKCGQRRKRIGFLPHTDPKLRIDLYVCEGCLDRSEAALLTENYGYEHETVDHSAKEYVRDDVHTNSIDGFWANVKRGINGTYVWVSKKHLQTYLREFEYRHNLRHQPGKMFDLLLLAFPKARVE